MSLKVKASGEYVHVMIEDRHVMLSVTDALKFLFELNNEIRIIENKITSDSKINRD